MPLIDLGAPRPAPVDLLDGLPRRVALTLPELRYVARRADDGLPDAVTSPGRRGLLVDPGATGPGRAEGALDAGLVGAVGLLATPRVALDLDVAVGGVHARSWQRQRRGAVATLSTEDGIVFELAWFPTAAWSDELTRAAVLPEDVVLRPSAVPDRLSTPFELADATGEAMRTSRSDLVPVLVAQHPGRTTDADGRPLDDGEAMAALGALGTESRGRLRVLVADVTAAETSVVGVVSWTLLADGWRALRPHRVGGEPHVEVRRVVAADLPGELAPVLAEVRAEAPP